MTPEQFRAVLEEVTRGTFPAWYVLALWALVSGIACATGAWVGAHVAERGRQQVTTNRLDILLRELHRTTQTAEDVKAQIAGGLWLEQKRWDQRRDVYWQLLRSLEVVSMACTDHEQLLRHAEGSPDDSAASKRRIDVALGKAQVAGSIATVILPEDALAVLHRAQSEFDERAVDGGPTLATTSLRHAVDAAIDRIANIARRDLGMPLAKVETE